MPRFVIERKIPGAGKLSPQELQGISQNVVRRSERDRPPHPVGPRLHAPDDMLYCVYIAPSAEVVREHAQRGGFPADRVSEVRSAIDADHFRELGAGGLAPGGRRCPRAAGA